MKQKISFPAALFFLMMYHVAIANESEPNNTPATANTLALNSSNKGIINPAGDQDWWKVTTNGDGQLSITLKPGSGTYTWVELYDTLGIIQLAGNYSNVIFSISGSGLAKGTYYIKIHCYNSSDTGSYTIADTLTRALQANDAEPNDTKAQAQNLNLNATTTGHIGYYYNNRRDTSDWYKITTNGDGRLRLSLTPNNASNVWIYLYDNNGTTLLNSTYSNNTFYVNTDGLAAGTYYLRINCYNASDFAPYTLSDSLFTPAPANDKEPNDTKARADTLLLNNSTTGHIGYYYNNKRDSSDWYKLTTNSDGRLRLSLTPANGINVWIYLYDNNGTILINSAYSAGPFSINTDGLAAGTYYLRINCYNTSDFAPYTLSDSLFTPLQANDKEPNDTKANADTLLLNGSTTGHVSYYYNNKRDSSDWYKLTTNSDGRLRLSLTPANGNNVWIYLYDNNGTTLINSAYSTGPFSINADGLAAGTYYLRINCYNTSDFAPYTLSDSLFKPVQANDKEPNDTKLNADTLNVNKSTTGHIGYYYNLDRDTTDWYKIILKTDGLLRLSLTPANGNQVWIYLYDNNGTTLINSNYSAGSFSIATDGLAAGTYYIRINCYHNSDFAPYTLSDSLFTYSNAVDEEPNDKPYRAMTISANGAVTGHVGFYYNNKRDTSDWWKINYSGDGSLYVAANFEPTKSSGYRETWLEIWKDTLAAPIFSTYLAGPLLVANLNSLTQGYYWVKLHCYNSDNFESYELVDSFIQVNVAAIKATSYDTAASCSSINNVSFSCSNSSPPYTVKLYRYGTLYGTRTGINKAVNFDSLPPGSYYARAYGDGASGSASGRSKNVGIIPVPASPYTTSITATQAMLHWTKAGCVKYDSIRYRVHGTLTWSTLSTKFNKDSTLLKGLTASTTYDWQVALVDSANDIIAAGAFSNIVVFTTATSPFADNHNENIRVTAENGNRNLLMVLPDPAINYFIIQYKSVLTEKVSAILLDVNGKAVWSSAFRDATSLDGKRVNTSQFAKGIYYLKLANERGELTATAKLVIAK